MSLAAVEPDHQRPMVGGSDGSAGSAADRLDASAASRLVREDPFVDKDSLCRACAFRAQVHTVSLGDGCCTDATAAEGRPHVAPVTLARLEKHRAFVLGHIEDMHGVSERFTDEVENALSDSQQSSDKSFEFRLVYAFVSLLNVISSVENSAQAMKTMSELLRRSAASSICFALLDGHAALVAMLGRSYHSHDEPPPVKVKPPVDINYSPVGTMKLSPDGYINTTARPRDKSTAPAPPASDRNAAAVDLLSGLTQLVSALSNCQVRLCTCAPREPNDALFDEETSLHLLPVNRSLSEAHKAELLSVFSASNISIHHCQLLLLLILSGRPLLVRIGAQLCYNLMRCNDINVIALELSGCITALVATVKTLLGPDPRLCSAASDAPWLLQLGRSTAFNCTPQNVYLPQYGYSGVVSNARSLRNRDKTSILGDEQKLCFSSELLEETFVYSLYSLSLVSILSAQNPNCVVLSMLTSMVHSAITKPFYSACDSEAASVSSIATEAVLDEDVPPYFYMTGGLHPVLRTQFSPSSGTFLGHVHVPCQLCQKNAATTECLSYR